MINSSQLKGLGKLASVSGLFVSCDQSRITSGFLATFILLLSPPSFHPHIHLLGQWILFLDLEVTLGKPSPELLSIGLPDTETLKVGVGGNSDAQHVVLTRTVPEVEAKKKLLAQLLVSDPLNGR